MSEQRRFGETDHEPLREDDVLAQAIGQWREELPSRDLWPGVSGRLRSEASDRLRSSGASASQASRSTFTFTLSQLAVAASLLIAVASGVTYLATNRAVLTGGGQAQQVIQAYSDPAGTATQSGRIVPANFADAQFNAAVSDLERILRDERGRLDPRTVLILERNLKAIDAAINEARMALDQDPANQFLNSHLADARRRKLDLLRHATELASTGGD
jgi:hypothetical protein